jgi:hypothetical protein
MIFSRSEGFGLALLLVGGVLVGGAGGELRRTGIHPLVDRTHAQFVAILAHLLLGRRAAAPGGIGEAARFSREQRVAVEVP